MSVDVKVTSGFVLSSAFAVNVAFPVIVTSAPALPTFVFPLYHPDAVYPSAAVILGNVTFPVVVFAVVAPIAVTFAPFSYVTT